MKNVSVYSNMPCTTVCGRRQSNTIQLAGEQQVTKYLQYTNKALFVPLKFLS